MKILVACALPDELNAVKKGIKNAKINQNLNLDYLCIGSGNYETIFGLEQYLAKQEELIFIWNIGVCGYWNNNGTETNSPIQIASVLNIHTEKESIIPIFTRICNLKVCYSGENVVLEKPEFSKSELNNFEEQFYDMESRGVNFVASKHKFPVIILKIPFDFVGKYNSLSEIKSKKLEMYRLLEGLDYHEYLLKILEWIDNQKY